MKTELIFNWIEGHNNSIKSSVILMLILFIPAIYGLVYLTGGANMYTHSLYLPILLGGFIFGIKGGLLVGVIAGFTLSPFMPIDTVPMKPQQTVNWLYRTGFFVAMGFLGGAAKDSVSRYVEHVKWFTQHDAESGLPNRSALIDVLKKMNNRKILIRSKILAVISIENALELEATFGPDITTEAVRQLASSIGELLGNKTAVYRISTYHIAALIPVEKKNVEGVRNQLEEEFRRPFSFKGISLHADIRVGYADLSKPRQEPSQYLQEAEAALKEACERAHTWAVFSPELDHGPARENLELLGELMEAVNRKQLELHYQPKVSLTSGAVLGVEALMRWTHPKLGNVPPGKFIPRAEQSTLIDMLTEWAIDEALTQMVEWRQEGINLPVAVNISTRNLLQPNFADKVLNLLNRHKVEGSSLEFEITEWALMTDIRYAFANMSQLSRAGIVFSIDDFGTGYASLQYLKDFPASSIKIDQIFIRRIWESKRPELIVESSVNLAHGLEIAAVAEGVEDLASYNLLAVLGCDIAQGYYISRPVPGLEFAEWYKKSDGIFNPVPEAILSDGADVIRSG